jgi:hypothetical protein
MASRPTSRWWLGVLAAGCVLALYAAAVPDPFYREEWPVRALLRNRRRVETYVGNLYAGRIPRREDGQGYHVLDVLLDADARYVRLEDGCVVISFVFMPTDAVPVLIHSPRGLAGLPEEYRPGARPLDKPPTWAVFGFRQIDEHWFYCRWDY